MKTKKQWVKATGVKREDFNEPKWQFLAVSVDIENRFVRFLVDKLLCKFIKIQVLWNKKTVLEYPIKSGTITAWVAEDESKR